MEMSTLKLLELQDQRKALQQQQDADHVRAMTEIRDDDAMRGSLPTWLQSRGVREMDDDSPPF